jgi:hypothetical protein
MRDLDLRPAPVSPVQRHPQINGTPALPDAPLHVIRRPSAIVLQPISSVSLPIIGSQVILQLKSKAYHVESAA